jgi:potassium efflux system protein
MHITASSTGSSNTSPNGAIPSVAGSVPAKLGGASSSTAPAASTPEASVKPPIRELLEERLRLLDEYEKTSQDLERVTHPQPTPEQQSAEARAELRELEAVASRADLGAEVLLPPLFRGTSVTVSRTLPSEMKAALEATSNEVKEWRTKLDTLKSEIAKWDGQHNARRAERDKTFQGLATLKARSGELASAVTDALSIEARRLARERLVNFEWQTRVQSLRLQLVEAQLALETRLAEVRALDVQIGRAHIRIGVKTLEQMQSHYRAAAFDQERNLRQQAANEEEKARRSDDPLERLRAGRSAELLKLETLVLKYEQAQAMTPSPSYDEQKTLADRAESDFVRIKKLLEDGDVSRLDTVRLNNEFRRIGPERDRLIKDELATVEAQIQFHENALTNVEIELMQDSLHNFESDLVRERLPRSRWAAGEAVLAALEKKHRGLLIRQRDALESLTTNGGHTLGQVVRRLGILDQEYGFIRTHIFWVRDQEPIGLGTLTREVHEVHYLLKALLRLAQESLNSQRWGQPSAEFLVTGLAALALPVGLVRLRRVLRVLIERDLQMSLMRAFRSLALGIAIVAVWPTYLVLLAYVSRVAPWPRSLGALVSAGLSGLAIAMWVHDLLRWLARPSGWLERHLEIPEAVVRQIGRAGRFIAVAAVVLLLPVYLFDHGLIAPEGRPVTAPSLSRMLILGFELVVWATCVRLLRRSSALLACITIPLSTGTDSDPVPLVSLPSSPWSRSAAITGGNAPVVSSGSRVLAWLAWLDRHRRVVAWLVLAAIAAVIALDVRGYRYTARRLAVGGSESFGAILLAAAGYRALGRVIDHHRWRWARPHRSWALALTSKVVLRASRARGATTVPEPPSTQSGPTDPADVAVEPEDVDRSLRRLSAFLVTVLALLVTAWIWDLDLALVRFLLSQPVWSAEGPTAVTWGNLMVAATILLLGALAWRHMSTLFALTIFPRMPDDPGVRFAVVTLSRYAVLGLSAFGVLGAIHLDLAKISVVLAALGVGLGFGLQEIVSNFVCGIILLLERPIRIGDVVTVAGSTGKVDRINIRATTIVNSDNQSMIVPNREFITGNLVNWTHKDRIVRVPIKVGVAYGTDPDRVVDLLLAIAREDVDVLRIPEPGASLEGFGDSALLFVLAAFVPDPGLAGIVRHRLCSAIQRRFAKEGIAIPYPTQELHLSRVPEELTEALVTPRQDQQPGRRHDPASRTPPSPYGVVAAMRPTVAPVHDKAVRRVENE